MLITGLTIKSIVYVGSDQTINFYSKQLSEKENRKPSTAQQ